MLIDGELDAVLGEKSDHPDLKQFFTERSEEELSWFAKYDVAPINHMVVVKQELSGNHPDIVREVHRLLSQAAEGTFRPKPDHVRRSLKMMIDYTAQQHLIPLTFAVDELFDDVTRGLWQ